MNMNITRARKLLKNAIASADGWRGSIHNEDTDGLKQHDACVKETKEALRFLVEEARTAQRYKNSDRRITHFRSTLLKGPF